MFEMRNHDLVIRPMLALPQLLATRLIASVAPRTNTISSGEPAPRKSATFWRAAS
jgi:hypothetical protein